MKTEVKQFIDACKSNDWYAVSLLLMSPDVTADIVEIGYQIAWTYCNQPVLDVLQKQCPSLRLEAVKEGIIF